MSTAATHEPRFLTPQEVARTLNVSTASVYRAIAAGRIPALRLADHGSLRVPRAALEEFAHPSEDPARAPRTGSEPAVEPQAHGGADTKEEE